MSLAVYNPIAGGMLAGKHHPGTPAKDTRFANNPTYYNRYWSDENFQAVEKLSQIAAQNGMTILELALRWCAGAPHVTSVITGVSKLSQLEQNIAALEGPALSADILEACDAGLAFSCRNPVCLQPINPLKPAEKKSQKADKNRPLRPFARTDAKGLFGILAHEAETHSPVYIRAEKKNISHCASLGKQEPKR